MALIEMRVDLSKLLDALVSGNKEQIIAAAREQLLNPEMLEYIHNREAADTLLGRVGMIAAYGDTEGHIITTLDAAASLSRYLHYIPQPLDAAIRLQERALPLFVQGLFVSVPAVRAGINVQPQLPSPFFPSDLPEGKTVNDLMSEAVFNNDAPLAERLLLGLYGTGADYRTVQVRSYEAIATTFQNGGHPLIFAGRGFQLLETVEWGERIPHIIHWLTPHLPLRPNSVEPAWIEDVRGYVRNTKDSVTDLRKRVATTRDENALPLRRLILSDINTTQICQGVYDALIKGGASQRAVASVIALAAADIVEMVGDNDRNLFIKAAHGLLYAAVVHLSLRQIQDVEILPLLFTAAAAINAHYKEITTQIPTEVEKATSARIAGGGLIAASQLETLANQIKSQDIQSALTTAQRYMKLGHDVRALVGTIGLAAARLDATADQGHSLQIAQAAGDEFINWPTTLATTNKDAFLRVALRAAAFGKPDPLVAQL